MSKCDLTVGKKFTLNTGNYSSIQPTVSITLHDIDSDKIKKAHLLMDVITDALLHLQIESDAVTMATIKKMGFGDYFKNINKDDMGEELIKAIRGINDTTMEDR